MGCDSCQYQSCQALRIAAWFVATSCQHSAGASPPHAVLWQRTCLVRNEIAVWSTRWLLCQGFPTRRTPGTIRLPIDGFTAIRFSSEKVDNVKIAFEKDRICLTGFPFSGSVLWVDDTAIKHKQAVNTVDGCRGSVTSSFEPTIFFTGPVFVVSQI